MRNNLIGMCSAVAAVAVAGSASATVVWQTFDSLATAGNAGAVSNTAANSAFVTSSSSVTITPDNWSSTRLLYAGERNSRMQITSNTAIFTTGKGPNYTFGSFTAPGNDGVSRIEYQALGGLGGVKNLTNFQFRLNVTNVTNGGGDMTVWLTDQNGLAGTLTKSVSANGYQTFDFSGQTGLSAIETIAFEFKGANATLGATRSVTVSSIQYAVPAPGAAALVGMAGLIASRRRKA